MLQYKAKFKELVCFAPHIAGDKEKKGKKFQRGLRINIRTMMVVLRLRTFTNVDIGVRGGSDSPACLGFLGLLFDA